MRLIPETVATEKDRSNVSPCDFWPTIVSQAASLLPGDAFERRPTLRGVLAACRYLFWLALKKMNYNKVFN